MEINRFLNDRNNRLLYFANLICRIFIPGFNKWYRDNKKNMSEIYVSAKRKEEIMKWK